MTITKDKILEDISILTGYERYDVEWIYDAINNYVFKKLSEADINNKVKIKLFDGLSIVCEYQPSKECIHPETRDKFKTKDKIWAKPKITRHYNRKLNDSKQ